MQNEKKKKSYIYKKKIQILSNMNYLECMKYLGTRFGTPLKVQLNTGGKCGRLSLPHLSKHYHSHLVSLERANLSVTCTPTPR